MKLNNKGMTTVEIVVCFVLVATISMSMYSLVSSFNDKREEESYRAKMLIYKATLTKKIQEDFIKKGLIYAKIEKTNLENNVENTAVDCTFKDGSTTRLEVSVKYTKHELHPEGAEGNPELDSDFFEIKYGPPSEMEVYELPDLGEVKGCYNETTSKFEPKSRNNNCYAGEYTSKDLKIHNVSFSISNETNTNDETSHILNIYIGFYHPELGNRYAINIVAPINYQ